MLRPNVALLLARQSKESFAVLVTRFLSTHKIVAVYDRTSAAPLYLYGDTKANLINIQDNASHNHHPNFAPQFINNLAARLNLRFLPDGRGDLNETFAPEDVFHYIYADFHSPTYRTRYSEFLKIDFPRVPLTTDRTLFRNLCQLGANLVALHLLEDNYAAASWNKDEGSKVKDEEIQIASTNPLSSDVVRFHDMGSLQVAKGYPKYADGKVHINPASYFDGVAEAVWNFHVGGYQVAHKWLKDRRERTLSPEDIQHYTRTCHALASTIEHMRLIDETIEAHGGFPLVGSQDAAPSTNGATNALPFA